MKGTALTRFFSPLFRAFYAGCGHILMFHRVCPAVERTIPASVIEVTPEYFERVIALFSDRGYHFASLNELPDLLAGTGKKKPFVIFTFDDGYIDNFTTAYPILKKHRIPFTVYISTDFPDRQAVLWWYMLEDLVRDRSSLDLKIGEERHHFECNSLSEKRTAATFARKMLKYAHPDDFLHIVDSVFSKNGVDPLEKVKTLAMSWSQIRELSCDPLITIGAHSLHHFALKLLDPESAKHEILGSKKLIEQKIDLKVEHFAYPFGGSNEAGAREFAFVRNAGYLTGTTSRMGNIFADHARHTECLPRLDVPFLKNLSTLKAALDGAIPARMNRFKRIVTL